MRLYVICVQNKGKPHLASLTKNLAYPVHCFIFGIDFILTCLTNLGTDIVTAFLPAFQL